MRLLTVFLFAASLAVSARPAAQTVSLSGKGLKLKQVFAAIEKQTGYVLFTEKGAFSETKTLSLSVRNLPLHEFLDMVLKDQPLEYEIVGKTIFLSGKSSPVLSSVPSPPFAVVSSDQAPITIKVLDSVGTPLSGASVSLKNSKISGVTDAEGVVSVDVNQGDVLFISFVGFETRQVTITPSMLSSSRSLVITLRPSVDKLEDVEVVVNTGYQTIAKERSAGSFAKPEMSIVRNRTGSTNILQRLEGLVPGLTVNNAPSAGANPLLVRGLSTVGNSNIGNVPLTNRNPLYVVDGIPMDDVSTINPQDVADITVLRDATASSIWGARAANGVIVIITKKGYSSGKTKIQYDGYANFQGRPDLNYIPVLNSRQYIEAAGDIFDPVVYPWSSVSDFPTYRYGVPPHERILYNLSNNIISAGQAKKSLDSLASINNIGQIKDLWYRPAFQMNHTLSVSGGQKNYTFYVSGAFTDIKSNRPGEKNNVYKINARQDIKISDRIGMYLITDISNTVTSSKRTIDVDGRFLPYQLFRGSDGSDLSMSYMQSLSDETLADYQERSKISLNYSPLDEYNFGTTKTNNLLSRNILGISAKLLKGIRFEGTYSYISRSTRGEMFDDLKSYPVRSEIVQFTIAPDVNSTPVYYLPANGGTFTVDETFQRSWTIRNQLVYDRSWDNYQHALTILAGQEAQEQRTIFNSSKVRGYNPMLQTFGPVDYATLGSWGLDDPVWANYSYSSVLPNDAFIQQESQTRFTSYYANAGYTYDNKYSLNASLRFDKSNLFGLDKSAQNKPVYAIGGKWRLKEESFMSGINRLRQLDVRVTYGITGNSPVPGTASSKDVIAVEPSPFFPGGTGAYINTPSNPHLGWERTSNINLGFDFRWTDRLSGSLDLYRKNTTNLIGNLPTNVFTGYSSIIGNVGDMQNKGVELSLTSANIVNKDFMWSTLLNISYNKNQITKFNQFTPITTGNALILHQYVENYAAFAVFAYRYAGLDDQGDPLVRLADGSTVKTPKITKPGDLKYMGTYQPVWNGGLSNMFNYKNWGLSINAVFNFGNVMRRDVNQFYTGRLSQEMAGDFTSGNVHAEFADRWKKAGDESITNIPSYISNESISISQRDVAYYTMADINVVSAAFIKMRDASLTYSIPSSVLRAFDIDQIILRAQISNVMLWKANRYGIDPEFQDAPEGIRTLIANQQAVSFGVNIKF